MKKKNCVYGQLYISDLQKNNCLNFVCTSKMNLFYSIQTFIEKNIVSEFNVQFQKCIFKKFLYKSKKTKNSKGPFTLLWCSKACMLCHLHTRMHQKWCMCHFWQHTALQCTLCIVQRCTALHCLSVGKVCWGAVWN